MSTLAQASGLAPKGGGLVVQLDPDWSGWGPAGGYLAVVALRAAGTVMPAGHRPVTISCQFLSAAQNGEADVSAEIIKPGAASCANVAFSQSGRRFFQAQIWATSRSRGPDETTAPMPQVPGPDALAPVESYLNQSSPKRVAFWSKIDSRPVEYRALDGPAPRNRRLQCWYRFRGQFEDGGAFLNAGQAAFLIDATVWASHWRTRMGVPDYVAPTLDTTVWFHDGLRAGGWMLIDAISDIARQGLLHGAVRVWSEDGRLIASGGSQCLVVPQPAT